MHPEYKVTPSQLGRAMCLCVCIYMHSIGGEEERVMAMP